MIATRPFEVVLDTKVASHQEWVDQRRLGLGGTDCAALLGHNPWKSVTSLYYEKLVDVLEPESYSASEAAYWGTRLEPEVGREFAIRSGYQTKIAGLHLRSTAFPWIRGTLDYWVYEPDFCPEGAIALEPTSFLECKTTAWYRGADWKNGKLPPYVRSQMLHYLALTGYDHAYAACLVGGQTFCSIELARPMELVREIIEMEERFWWHVENRIEPPDPFTPIDIFNPDDFAPDEVAKVVLLDADHVAKIQRYWELVRINHQTYDEVTALREELEGLMYGARLGLYGEETLLEWVGARAKRRFLVHGPKELSGG